jgi:hypothetical protein
MHSKPVISSGHSHRPVPALRGSTVAGLAARVQEMTGGNLHPPAGAACTITALLILRDQVIAPILAGCAAQRMARKPAHWTPADRDYETSAQPCMPCSTTSKKALTNMGASIC